ncbi:MAG: hypothetical protein H8E66_03525 [Planctomycetes bacterium]|nr:hypothetical protein [Planctomycetota bacterium]
MIWRISMYIWLVTSICTSVHVNAMEVEVPPDPEEEFPIDGLGGGEVGIAYPVTTIAGSGTENDPRTTTVLESATRRTITTYFTYEDDDDVRDNNGIGEVWSESEMD